MAQPSDIVNAEHAYSVSIPEVTPNGQVVTIQTGSRGGLHIMHAETPDQSELYFEVATCSDVMDHARLADDQRRYLKDQAPDAELTVVVESTAGPHLGTTFDFRGTLQGRFKVRRFLFLDGPSRTYRVVHDPRSPLNERVLESFRMHGHERPDLGVPLDF